MPGPGLPVTVDTTYADDGTDATVKLHQQHHDVLHAFANEFDTATRLDGQTWVRTGGLWLPSFLESKNVPTTTFELTPGGNYTFVLADAGKLKGTVSGDSAALNFTIPPNSSVAFPIGTTMKALQRGTGQITTVAGTGVVFVLAGSGTKSSQQGGTLLYTKLFSDTWLLEGGIN